MSSDNIMLDVTEMNTGVTGCKNLGLETFHFQPFPSLISLFPFPSSFLLSYWAQNPFILSPLPHLYLHL